MLKPIILYSDSSCSLCDKYLAAKDQAFLDTDQDAVFCSKVCQEESLANIDYDNDEFHPERY